MRSIIFIIFANINFNIYYSHFFRNLTDKHLGIKNADNYEWETHIFFDDAFQPDKSGNYHQVYIDIIL